MTVSEKIEKVEVKKEFHVCPVCGYDRGFHVSFLKEDSKNKIILICPDCGARFYTGWIAE